MSEIFDENVFRSMVQVATQRRDGRPVVHSHPADVDQTETILGQIEQMGGVEEVWKPVLVGMVTEVETYHLTEDQKRLLGVEHDVEQSVYYLAETGLRMHLQWDNRNPSRKDADWSDFPDGFSEDDCIRVECKGARIIAVRRITPDQMNQHIAEKYL